MPDFSSTVKYLKDNTIPNDVIITVGAGDVWEIGDRGVISSTGLNLYLGQRPGVVVWLDPQINDGIIQRLNEFIQVGGRVLMVMGGLSVNQIKKFSAMQTFFRDFVRATPTALPMRQTVVRGIPGDPITGGLTFKAILFAGFVPHSGTRAILIDTTRTVVGLRTDERAYRVIYIGFDPLTTKVSGVADTLILKAIRWLSGEGDSQTVQPRAKAVEGTASPPAVPDRVILDQNVPNPFNSVTLIHFGLPVAGRVMLTIYDLKGRRVQTLIDRFVEAGFTTLHWDGTDNRGHPLASGVYFYRLIAGNTTQTRKIVLLR